ncbi:hypothetical protein D3C87_49780 [compost metagenome]
MASLFIKGTALVTHESYKNDPTCLGSYLICAMETWTMQNFANTGEFIVEYPNEVKRKYGEVRSANEAFQNDIHNLTIGHHQMKHVMDDQQMESGLKGLYLGNLVEHYITNVRCIYDHMAVFARVVVDHKYLPQRNVSTESLNTLLKFIKANESRAAEIFTERMTKRLLNMENSLQTVKTIRDAIIHDGKEPMITFSKGMPQITIIRNSYKRDESLLPDLLELGSLDYPMFPYLQRISNILFTDMERMGEEIITYFALKDENYRFELVALIGICIEEFIGFINKDYAT